MTKVERKLDHNKGSELIDSLIQWTNADHEEQITLTRDQCCYIRDEIQRLREGRDGHTIAPCSPHKHVFSHVCAKCGWRP